jgi:PDZ-binding kinase
LKKLNHPNIVGFRAFVEGEDGRYCLAMEECDASVGDLIEIRSEQGLGSFRAEKILKVALDISKALHYLHTECHLLHGDLKSHNVLVRGVYIYEYAFVMCTLGGWVLFALMCVFCILLIFMQLMK